MLWVQWHRVFDWKQINPGYLETIGYMETLKRRPVTVSISWFELNGHLVTVYNSPSTITDWDLVREWMKDNVPAYRERKEVDPMNFHQLIHDLVPNWRDDEEKI